MRLRFSAALIVFIGSYFPLSVIWLAQNITYSKILLPEMSSCVSCMVYGFSVPVNNAPIVLMAMAVTFACLTFSVVALISIPCRHLIVIRDAKPLTAEVMNYVLPYVVSFMAIDHSKGSSFAGVTVFMIWLFIILYRSEQILLNPIFLTFGWIPYEIKYNFSGDSKVHTARALSRSDIALGERYLSTEVSGVTKIVARRS